MLAESAQSGIDSGAERRGEGFLHGLETARDLADVENLLAQFVAQRVDQRPSINFVDALAAASKELLRAQDDFRSSVANVGGALCGRQALFAQETLRRLLTELLGRLRRSAASESAGEAPFLRPSMEFVGNVMSRLLLLILGIERLASVARTELLRDVVLKALETSATLKDSVATIGLDLTPWLDAPPDLRLSRIQEAAAEFAEALTDEERDSMRAAWTVRTDLPGEWQPGS